MIPKDSKPIGGAVILSPNTEKMIVSSTHLDEWAEEQMEEGDVLLSDASGKLYKIQRSDGTVQPLNLKKP